MQTPVQKIAATMLAQNTQGVKYPVFCVRHTTKVFVEGHDYDGAQRKSPETVELTSLCESCLALHNKSEAVPESCDECFVDAWNYYKYQTEVVQRAGFFVTGKACQEYINANVDNLDQDPHPYMVSAEGNPELEQILEHIISQLTDEIHPVYAK